mgnify:CR=1 FL=1
MYKIALFSCLVLASCQSEVCECADQWLEMTQEIKKASEKGVSLDKVLKKYEASMKKCENMDANLTAAEKEQMLEELRACESYKKIGKD